jgi:hypothetical protein
MSKKSITELHSIAKDALAIVEQIKNGKFSLSESEILRLKHMQSYFDTLKESAELQYLWENATAGASSAGSIATVVGGGSSKPIKRMDEYTNEPKMTPVDEKGKPLKKTNDAKLKKVKVKEDLGVIEPVTNDETTALNNLKSLTGSQYSGTQVGNAINKAKSGATLTTTDQKVLQPILNTVGNIVDDPNSANQFRSTAGRAGAINVAKTNAMKQQQQKAQQTQQQNQQQQTNNPTNSNNPVNQGNIGANQNSLGSNNSIGTQFQSSLPKSNAYNAESKSPKGKRISETNKSSLMKQYLNFKGTNNGNK